MPDVAATTPDIGRCNCACAAEKPANVSVIIEAIRQKNRNNNSPTPKY
jgi:hypothetical protein